MQSHRVALGELWIQPLEGAARLAAVCGLWVALTALPVLAQPPTDGCSNPTAISGLGPFPPFVAVPASPSIGGPPVVCFPGGGGQPSQLGNDLWYVWSNTNCAGILVDVTVPGATVAFYRGLNTCPASTVNADCCAPNTVNCEVECCDTVLIQIGNLPASASGALNISCVGPPVSCLCPCVNAPGGMVAWYTGDDTTPADYLGNHDGTFVGSPVSSSDWKVGGGAMSFDSSSGTYAIVQDHNALDFGTSDFSIDLWVQRTAGSGVQPLVDKRGPHPVLGTTRGYMLFLNNGLLSLQLFDQVGSFNYTSGLVVPVDTNWHFVGVTVDRDSPTGLVMSVGNKPTGQLTTQSFDPRNRIGDLDNNANLLLGGHHPIAPVRPPFDGLLDEVELYSRALTQFEIQSIFLANSAGKCKCCPTPRMEADIVPCPCGDGIVDLNDILAVLDGFAGIDPCP